MRPHLVNKTVVLTSDKLGPRNYSSKNGHVAVAVAVAVVVWDQK